MCGRARCALSPEQACEATHTGELKDSYDYKPTPNAFPGCYVPVLYQSAREGRTLRAMKWGLIPSFSKPERTKDGHFKFESFRMFNARGESVNEKPSFKRLVDRKRCVVLVDGFYEWKLDARGEKQPFLVHRADGKPLMLAGLYDTWWPPESSAVHAGSRRPASDGEGAPDDDRRPVYSFTILTRPPRPDLAWLHDRQPIMLDDHDAERWIFTPHAVRAGDAGAGEQGSAGAGEQGSAAVPPRPAKKARRGSADDRHAPHPASSTPGSGASASDSADTGGYTFEALLRSPGALHAPLLPPYCYGEKTPSMTGDSLSAASSSYSGATSTGEASASAQKLGTPDSVGHIAELAVPSAAARLPAFATERSVLPLAWHPCDKRMNNLKYQEPDAGKAVPSSAVSLKGGWEAEAAACGTGEGVVASGVTASAASRTAPTSTTKGSASGSSGGPSPTKKQAAAAASHTGPKLDAFFPKQRQSSTNTGGSSSGSTASSAAHAPEAFNSDAALSSAASRAAAGKVGGKRDAAANAMGPTRNSLEDDDDDDDDEVQIIESDEPSRKK